MTAMGIALVAPASSERERIAQYLRDRGYEVVPCDQLSIATPFAGVVLVDASDGGDAWGARVHAWIAAAGALRVVVVTAKPAGWRALSLALSDQLAVLAAPAFGWEIIDALRAGLPELPAG